MLYQGLFRIIKWVLTGDSRTILAEKHDARPVMILARLLIVLAVAGALVLLVIFIAQNDTILVVLDFLAALASVFSPVGVFVFLLVLFLVLLFVVFVVKTMIENLFRWLTTLFDTRNR